MQNLVIEQFRNCHRIGPYDYVMPEEDRSYYELTGFKTEFFCTKYAEYNYSVPRTVIDGEFIELGVFKGRSIKYLAKLKPDVTWWGFDTFEGIDEVWELGGKRIDMNTFATPLPQCPDNVELVKGLFEETLLDWKENTVNNRPLAYINMDADVYSATKYALEALDDVIVPGTIIRFDELSDWRVMRYETDSDVYSLAPDTRYTKWRDGEWKALKEWLSEFDREVEPAWRNWHQSAGVVVTK